MARPSRRAPDTTIEAVIQETAQRVVERVSAAVARHVSALVKQGLERELAAGRGGGARRVAGRARPRVELSRWVADTRARRVPTFVIEATGLDTKKKIVAKFGENAAFEKGKPLPKPKAA